MKLSQKDLIQFNELIKDKSLVEAMLKPVIIDESNQKSKGILSYPLIICDNPDTELKKVPEQINFILPESLIITKEPYAINIKNDLYLYIKLYEKHSKETNKIIEQTKDSIKKLYGPLKKLRNEVKKYGENFDKSIEQLKIPIENAIKGLNKIKYENYPEEQKTNFLRDKNEVINEVNEFYKEASDFYHNYKILNKNNSEEIEDFVKKFTELATPAKELSNFMKNFFISFEKSADDFNDLDDKKKIDDAFEKIKKPLEEFSIKSASTKKQEKEIEKMEKEKKLEQINNKVQEIKNKMKLLSDKSLSIANKINEIREKYNEEAMSLLNINPIEVKQPNVEDANEKLDKENEEIEKKAKEQKELINEDKTKVNNQSRLDLLFIMDITNSMDLYLEEVKTRILDMIDKIKNGCAGIKIYLGFIGYRDFSDLDFGEEYINLELTDDYNNIKNNIQYLDAHGGGDVAEDLCGALEMGDQKRWEGNSRFAILVTDSPCHGEKYHHLQANEDNYLNGDRNNRNIEEYIKSFSEKQISLFCLKINHSTNKMFEIFEEIYNKNKVKDSNSSFVAVEGEQLFNLVTENAIKIFQNRKSVEI